MTTQLENISDNTQKQISKVPGARCWECPLQNEVCVPTSFPKVKKPEGQRVAFVSRSPGKHDARAGFPFAGPSGKVLDYLLRRYGWSRDEILTTNVVLCKVDDPTTEAIRACKPRLEAELAEYDLVIAGGTEATSGLTRYRAVARARGFSTHRKSVSGRNQRVVVTNNPAAVIRDSDKFPDMVQDFKRAFDPPPPHKFPEVEIIDDPGRAYNVLALWNQTNFDLLAADLEWTQTYRITAAGFSRTGSKAIVFGGGAISDDRVFCELKTIFEREDVRFAWHNGKADTKTLYRNGIEGRIDEDTFLMSYALDERPGYHSLEYMLSSEFGWPDYEPDSVKHFKKTGEFLEPIATSQRDDLYRYNGYDAAGTMQLFNLLSKRIDEQSLETLYRERLLPVATALRTVELNGFHYDIEGAADLNDREVIPRLHGLTGRLRTISSHPLLNPRSPKQVAAIWYEEWGLKHNLRDSGKKKFSHSAAVEVREEILASRFTAKPQHVDQLRNFAFEYDRFQKIDKQRGTYIEGLCKRAADDGKIYYAINEGGTATGRVSTSDPNLQNITREGPQGTDIPGIRTLFLPSPGNVIVSADFSQAELRTCAILSGERNLLAIYADNTRSLHKERAAAFYGVDYTKEQYVKSKNINFGVTYGQSAQAFAQMYHMDEREAQNYINAWWNEFPALLAWTRSFKKIVRSNSAVIQSPFGHRRRFHLVTEENVGDCERQAINFIPQNIAAWLTLSAVRELVVDHGIRVVATVHDSIVADVPSGDVSRVARLMKDVMESQPGKQLMNDPDHDWLAIPFTADISMGPTWGDLKEVEV